MPIVQKYLVQLQVYQATAELWVRHNSFHPLGTFWYLKFLMLQTKPLQIRGTQLMLLWQLPSFSKVMAQLEALTRLSDKLLANIIPAVLALPLDTSLLTATKLCPAPRTSS